MLRLLLLIAVAGYCSAQVVSSTFLSSSEEWQYVTAEEAAGEVAFSPGSISRTDAGQGLWWFVSPPSYGGDRRNMYNGILSFTMAFTASNDNNRAPLQAEDVVLVAQCGYTLSKRSVITPGHTKTYEVLLNEDGWIDSRTKRAPNVFDFLGVLNNLDSIRIRGAFFTGAETTELRAVTVREGTTWFPCCTMTGDIDMCSKPGSPYFNPTNLKFYCEGSQKKRITVTKVEPRFGRRTGGTTITVTGTNFGWAGSNPTVRVGGVPCKSTVYPTSSVAGSQVMTVKGPTQETVVICETAAGEGTDRSVTVEASTGGTDSPYNVRMLRNERGWGLYETSSESCIDAKSRGFAFGGFDWSWGAHIQDSETTQVTAGVHKALAVDPNTGDVYVGGSILHDKALTLKLGTALIQDTTTVECALTTGGSCGYVIKYNREGKFQWSVRVEADNAAATGSTVVTSLAVDPTEGAVYLSGTLTTGASGAYVPKVFGVTSGGTTPASTSPTANARAIFIAKVLNDRSSAWINPINRCAAASTSSCSGAATPDNFGENVLVATYRASVSSIINQHTKGDNPSLNYIQGIPRDNGGVYLAGSFIRTSATTHWSFFGPINSAYIPTVPVADDYVQLGPVGSTHTLGFVVKYDSLGNAQWIRTFTSSTATTFSAAAISSLVAHNDAVFVSMVGTINAAVGTGDKFILDSCAFSTRVNNKGADNINCKNNGVDYSLFPTSVTPTSNSFTWTTGDVKKVSLVAAYSAGGVVKWHKTPYYIAGTPTRFTFEVTSMAFMRPYGGGSAIAGQVSDDTAFARGFYLYVGGNYDSEVTTFRITSGGMQFPGNTVDPVDSIFLLKLHTADGTPDWESYWGTRYITGGGSSNVEHLRLKALAADWVSGAIFLAGSGISRTNPSSTIAGSDHFAFDNRRYAPGCMPSPLTDESTINFGTSFCQLVSLKDYKQAGFIAKVTDALLDSREQVVSAKPTNDGTSRPSVVWMKTFGMYSSTSGMHNNDESNVLGLSADNGLVALGYYNFHTQSLATDSTFSFPNLPGTFSGIAAAVTRLDE